MEGPTHAAVVGSSSAMHPPRPPPRRGSFLRRARASLPPVFTPFPSLVLSKLFGDVGGGEGTRYSRVGAQTRGCGKSKQAGRWKGGKAESGATIVYCAMVLQYCAALRCAALRFIRLFPSAIHTVLYRALPLTPPTPTRLHTLHAPLRQSSAAPRRAALLSARPPAPPPPPAQRRRRRGAARLNPALLRAEMREEWRGWRGAARGPTALCCWLRHSPS